MSSKTLNNRSQSLEKEMVSVKSKRIKVNIYNPHTLRQLLLLLFLVLITVGIIRQISIYFAKPALQTFRLRTVSNRFQLANRESLGFFEDITVKDWCRKKKLVREQRNHCSSNELCMGSIGGSPAKPHVWYQMNWEPSFSCSFVTRQGMGDGPKWICDPHLLFSGDKPCLVYSIGSNNNFLFEESIHAMSSGRCEIHTFDPGSKISKKPTYVNYHQWGISSTTSESMKTLADTIEFLGHAHKTVDIMKMDCEGCEWATFEGWFKHLKNFPTQILLEMHKGTTGTAPVPADQLLQHMRDNNYVIFQKEPNTLQTVAKGECIEYSFLHLAPAFFTESSICDSSL